MEITIAGIGTIEYETTDITNFTRGLYGFEESTRFLLLPAVDPELPFLYLKSLDDEELQFIVTNPFLFIESYDFELSDTILDALEIQDIADIAVYNLVVIKEEVSETSINLKAPIIMNHKTMKATQVILAEDYAYKHPLFKKEGE